MLLPPKRFCWRVILSIQFAILSLERLGLDAGRRFGGALPRRLLSHRLVRRGHRPIGRVLGPSGRLVPSVPCAAEAFEEYLNINEYGVLKSGEDGYVFGQRFYDEGLLESRILQIVGSPVRTRIFGEKIPEHSRGAERER